MKLKDVLIGSLFAGVIAFCIAFWQVDAKFTNALWTFGITFIVSPFVIGYLYLNNDGWYNDNNSSVPEIEMGMEL
ncbi:MAG: hypothetical protein WC631_01005 [Candidatus Paceibacterota bacterium]|jgi:hypothetical protein